MKGKFSKRLGVLIALAVAMQIVVIPVAQAAAAGTATITSDRTMLSGVPENAFTLQVKNSAQNLPLALAQNISNVAVTLPDDQLTLIGATPPTGWSAQTVPGANRVIFRVATGGTPLAGGALINFTINASVIQQPLDTARNWNVMLSDNVNGNSARPATAASAGALTTTTRVLKVLGVALNGDSRVTDGTVTAGQGPLDLRATIQNAGTGTVTVSPTLTGLGDGSAGAAGPLTLGPGEQGFATFPTTFGSAGSVTPSVDANGTGVDGIPATGNPITIQTPFAATYAGASLLPTDVVPGEAYGFGLNVNKTGQVGADLAQGSTLLAFGPGFSSSLAAPVTFAADNDPKGLSFVSTTVPESLADGTYSPTLTLAGTDSNGKSFSVVPTIGDQIRLDRGLPVITPTITPPSSQVAGETPAITNNATLTFGGTITDNVTAAACANCTISSAKLLQFDGAGNALAPINVSATNNNGTITGSYASVYDIAARSVKLSVTAVKRTGRSATNVSTAIPVDNQAPLLSEALTGGATQALDKIEVTLTEGVTAGNQFAPADWTVQDNIVEAVSVAGRVITLDLRTNLGLDDQPLVTYAATAVGTRHKDRVGLLLANGSLVSTDGLIPPAPVISSIAGLAIQDGTFYTNDSTPDFVVTDLSGSQTVSIYEDLNGNEAIDGGDRLLARESTDVGEDTLTLTSGDLGTTDREVTLLGQIVDARDNAGDTALFQLALDFTLPTVGTVTGDVDGVTVGISEALARGTSGSNDWTVIGNNSSGVRQPFGADDVALTAGSIRLDISDSDWVGTLLQVKYILAGSESSRYEDRAGNPLADFVTP